VASDNVDVVVVNDFTTSTVEARTRASGKTRYTVSIKSEPILHDFDELKLGKAPAEAIRDLLKRQVQAIGEFAAPATRAYRQRAVDAMARGARWAARRYSGGRTGVTPPNQTQRLFNDSGRLANGFTVTENKTSKAWTVNVPANRLDPTEFKGDAFQRMIQRLVEHVPALRGGDEVLKDPAVRKAIEKATAEAIVALADGARQRALGASFRALKTAYSYLLRPILLG